MSFVTVYKVNSYSLVEDTIRDQFAFTAIIMVIPTILITLIILIVMIILIIIIISLIGFNDATVSMISMIIMIVTSNIYKDHDDYHSYVCISISSHIFVCQVSNFADYLSMCVVWSLILARQLPIVLPKSILFPW